MNGVCRNNQILSKVIDLCALRMSNLGLRFTREHDFDALASVLTPNLGKVNPAFLPACSDIAPGSAWIRVTDAAGRVVATHADRLFRAADYGELLRTGRLWSRDGFATPPGCMLDISRSVHGAFGHGGALWIAPEYRGRGLTGPLVRLARAYMMLNHDLDAYTGFWFAVIKKKGIADASYGLVYQEQVVCPISVFPPLGAQASAYAGYAYPRDLFLDYLSVMENIGTQSNQHIDRPTALG